MNIFSVLNKGKSRLHETSISAILAYFLDPKESHGLGNIFLEAFLQLAKMRKMSDYDISEADVDLENPILGGKFIDIDVGIPLKNDRNVKSHRFLIENKINASAAQEDQLVKYYSAYQQEYKHIKNLSTTVVFITPAGDNEKLIEEFDNLEPKKSDGKIQIFWQGMGIQGSIQKIIRNEILGKESAGEISPINEYVKHTLKAFAMHLENMSAVSNVLRYSRKRKNSESDGVIMTSAGDEQILMVSGYEVIQQGWKYYVRQNGEKVIAKAAFREIIKKEKLDQITKFKKKNVDKLTTYQLGAAVWKELAAPDKSES